ncbi:DegT/DnrJ/EryC1/StrS family aminotransferase [Streptomyces actuosus]
MITGSIGPRACLPQAGGRGQLRQATNPRGRLQPRPAARRHHGGVACEMDRLSAIVERHGLALAEDDAHGPGGRCHGRALGSPIPSGRRLPRIRCSWWRESSAR